jgi:hypothetical protein
VLATGAEVTPDVRALADAVLQKPFGDDDLLRVIGRVSSGRGRGPRRS